MIYQCIHPSKLEFMRAGILCCCLRQKITNFAAKVLGIDPPEVYALPNKITYSDRGLTAVEKIFNKNKIGGETEKVLHAGSDVRVKVNIVGSQDTTGLMTSQELESMAG